MSTIHSAFALVGLAGAGKWEPIHHQVLLALGFNTHLVIFSWQTCAGKTVGGSYESTAFQSSLHVQIQSDLWSFVMDWLTATGASVFCQHSVALVRFSRMMRQFKSLIHFRANSLSFSPCAAFFFPPCSNAERNPHRTVLQGLQWENQGAKGGHSSASQDPCEGTSL